MTGKLVDLLGGTGTFHQMLMLVTAYVVSIGIVQVSRYFKRFYVRRFANNVNRHMKQILYGTLVRKSRLELEVEGTGNVLTKAILDDPFSALDPKTEAQIFTNLKELAKDSIMILISHRLYLFDQMDQVIWMDERHAKVGTHEELLATVPSYAELCSNQRKGGSF